eukprot:c16462_g1_i1 orf=3-203(-)
MLPWPSLSLHSCIPRIMIHCMSNIISSSQLTLARNLSSSMCDTSCWVCVGHLDNVCLTLALDESLQK